MTSVVTSEASFSSSDQSEFLSRDAITLYVDFLDRAVQTCLRNAVFVRAHGRCLITDASVEMKGNPKQSHTNINARKALRLIPH